MPYLNGQRRHGRRVQAAKSNRRFHRWTCPRCGMTIRETQRVLERSKLLHVCSVLGD